MTTDFLEEHPDRPTLAKELGVSEHTVHRYELLPNGLPSLMIGGKKRYPRKTTAAWLESRIHRPNPIRERG
jgi:hypothetical protein